MNYLFKKDMKSFSACQPARIVLVEMGRYFSPVHQDQFPQSMTQLTRSQTKNFRH